MKLQVLGEKGVAAVDKAAHQILEKTGVLVPHERMLDLFARAGAKVDTAAQRVRIPGKLVQPGT